MAISIQKNDKCLNKSLLNLMIYLYRHNTTKFTITELNNQRFFSCFNKLKENIELGIQKKLIKKTTINGKTLFEIKAQANDKIMQIYLDFY
jgi:hypothetical protein